MPHRVRLSDVSGCRVWLPPVMIEICGLVCSKPGGTPSAAQFGVTLPLHGSCSEGSKHENVSNNSPIDGARKPSAQVPRKVQSSTTCQRKPNLLLVVLPKFE